MCARNTAAERPSTPTTFTDSTTVNLVNIDVYATDKKGRPVESLTKDDLTLRVNEKRTTISNFYLAREWQPIRFIVYLDSLHLSRNSRRLHLEKLGPFLQDRLDRGDYVSVISFDGSLERVQEFTGSWPEIQMALDRSRKHQSLSASRTGVRRNSIDLLRSISSGVDPGTFCTFGGSSFVSTHSVFAYDLLRKSTHGLQTFISTLAGLPGRRVLIYLSDGLSTSPGKSTERLLDDLCEVQARAHTEPLRGETISSGGTYSGPNAREDSPTRVNADHSAANTILANASPRERFASNYRLDTLSLFRDVVSEANSERLILVGLSTLDRSTETAPGADQYYSTASHSTGVGTTSGSISGLSFISDQTGGVTLFNAGKLQSELERLSSSLETYYSLGFTANEESKHSQLAIDLGLTRSNTRGRAKQKIYLRYRKSVRVKSRIDTARDRMKAVLLYGEPHNPHEVRLTLGDSAPFDTKLKRASFQVTIPLKTLILVPDSEKLTGSVLLYTASLDSKGGFSSTHERHIPVELPQSLTGQLRRLNYTYSGYLLLRPGEQRIGVCMRDELNNRESCVIEDSTF